MRLSDKKPSAPTGTHLSAAVPGALTAVLLAGAVAFGATGGLRSFEPTGATDAAGSAPKAAGTEVTTHEPKPAQSATGKTPHPEPVEEPIPAAKPKATDEPKQTAKPKPTEKPAPAPETAKPRLVETPKPKPAATQKPKPAPTTPGVLALEGWARESKVKLGWKPFGGEGFEYYKVVRSTDGTVTWPASGDDVVIGVIGDVNATWWTDVPSCGKAGHYRVFAVRHGDAGYVTLAASNTVAVTTTCPPAPTPGEVAPLWFELHVKPGTGIKLVWEKYAGDAFVAYKIVRSKTNADPRFPLNEGTELIAAIGDRGQTHFLDASVAPGEAWTYRVVAVANGGAGYFAIGQTVALTATAQ